MLQSVLEVTTKSGKRRLLMTGEEPVTIGRDPLNSLAPRDPEIDPFHCVIEQVDGTFQLRDLGSQFGTRVNGKKVRDKQLVSGDVITAGRFKVTYLVEQPPQKKAQGKPKRSKSASKSAEDPPSGGIDMAPTRQDTDITSPAAGPAFDGQSSGGVAVDTGSADDSDLRDTPPADDIESMAIAGREHEQQIQSMIDHLPPQPIDTTGIKLVNARGQIVHGGTEEDIRATVQEGRDGVLFLRMLLRLCLHIRATDLHVEPKSDKFQVRVRVDGMMVAVLMMHSTIGQRLQRLVKVLCDMDIGLQAIVQDGHFVSQVPGRRIDYRVSFTPAVHGQKLVLRVLDQMGAPSQMRDLGLPAWMSREVGRVIHQNSGMVLMCGPTGSGKTTSLYALIREIDVARRNVITIEDPVEYQIEGVTQIPINEKQGNSFSNLLRSVLRQDPDVILVGEIRDTETAKIAMQAAITGHLVFSTVHAQDGIGTVFRLLNLGVEPYLVASGLNLVLAQRLVRKLCPQCKRGVRLSPGQAMRLAKYGVGDLKLAYTPIGCPQCLDTGYIGRRAIFELLQATDDLKDVILSSSQIQDMRKTIRTGLFSSLSETGYRLVAEGETSIEEIQRVVGAEG